MTKKLFYVWTLLAVVIGALGITASPVQAADFSTTITGPASHDGLTPFIVKIEFGDDADYCGGAANDDTCFKIGDIQVTNGYVSALGPNEDATGTMADGDKFFAEITPLAKDKITIEIPAFVTDNGTGLGDDYNKAGKLEVAYVAAPDRFTPVISFDGLVTTPTGYPFGYHNDSDFYVEVKWGTIVEFATLIDLTKILVNNGQFISVAPTGDAAVHVLRIRPDGEEDVIIQLAAELVKDRATGALSLASNVLTVPFLDEVGDHLFWRNDPEDRQLLTPYYGGQIYLEYADPDAKDRFPGIPGYTFGRDQLFAVQPTDAVYTSICGEETVSYVRVRIEAQLTDPDDDYSNLVEGAFAAAIFLDTQDGVTLPGKPKVAYAANDANGVIDIVGEIPAGATYGVVLAEVGEFMIDTDWYGEALDSWITQGDEPGGGVIIDFRYDSDYDSDARAVQFSTEETAYWVEESFPYTDSWVQWGAGQYWLDIPAGDYTVGMQQVADEMPDQPFPAPDVSAESGAVKGPYRDNWVYYAGEVAVPELAYYEWTPQNESTIEAMTEVECGPWSYGYLTDNFMGVFLNVVDGFLYDDLSPGFLEPEGYCWYTYGEKADCPDGRLKFWYNPGFLWDLAIAVDGHESNWLLVSLAFNIGADDLTFDLCETGVQFIEPEVDKDWDSAVLDLTMPGGNLTGRNFPFLVPGHGLLYDGTYGSFDILGYTVNEGLGPKYMNEKVFLLAKAGCCGEPGPFEAEVTLDHVDFVPGCCTADKIPLACCDATNYVCNLEETVYNPDNLNCIDGCPGKWWWWWKNHNTEGPGDDGDLRPDMEEFEVVCDALDAKACRPVTWYYTFEPTIPLWDFDLVDVTDCMEPCEFNCLEPAYNPVFGNGPFQSEAGVNAPGEFSVADLGTEVELMRDIWTDAFGNKLLSVKHTDSCINLCVEDCEECHLLNDLIRWPLADVVPQYTVTEAITGEVVVEAEGWDVTSLGPVTDIGRYKYEWMLEHGYLGDIKGHESLYEDVCCVEEDPCDCDCEPGVEETCEYPIRVDGGHQLFAISADDARMSVEWAWAWIEAMYELDLTVGVDAENYGPSMTVNRAQMAVFMSKVLQEYGLMPSGDPVDFADVPADHWAAAGIAHVQELGITGGCGGGNFCPLDPVTRAQMAIFIERTFRAVKTAGLNDFWWDENLTILAPGTSFVDVPLDHWANIWIEELLADGLTSGCKVEDGNRYFCPTDPVTRAQMARFIIGAMLTNEEVQDFWPSLAPELE